jgi:hypothetical protein
MRKMKLEAKKKTRDSIVIDCPHCGQCRRIEFGAPKKVSTQYDLDAAPKEMYNALKEKMPVQCLKCEHEYKVKSRMIPYRYTVST